ncbi:MAG: hypothetical protein H5T68_06580 [Chloroflexi bacterium]|nr:hypothetical protein [Chloroflexota bacterium]
MKKWEYDITSYSIEQVLAIREKLGYPPEAERPVMFCTDKGMCFFDNIPNPNIHAILHILNSKGAEGWQLATITFRADEMLCFWMREAGAEAQQGES